MKITRKQLRQIIKEELDGDSLEVEDSDGLDNDGDGEIDEDGEHHDLQENIASIMRAIYPNHPWNPMPLTKPGEGFSLGYSNRSSTGNRYVDTTSLGVFQKDDPATARSNTLSPEDASRKLSHFSAHWRTIANGVADGIFNGPHLLQAVDEAARMISSSSHVQDLSKAVREIIIKAYWEDARNGSLLSNNYTYTYTRKTGWSRST